MARTPSGGRAMTGYERLKRYRERKRAAQQMIAAMGPESRAAYIVRQAWPKWLNGEMEPLFDSEGRQVGRGYGKLATMKDLDKLTTDALALAALVQEVASLYGGRA